MERAHRIDLKLLRYFLAVAEELHFGRAAARLNMSQPPLSIHIKELEQQLGTLLFIRHSRSVALTHAGKVLMEESRRLLASANQALARVEQIGRGEAGRIELGVVGTALWGRMRPAMRHFLKANPNVEVLFREKSPGMQMALLERRELDAGIWRMAIEPAVGFTSIRLHESAFMVQFRKITIWHPEILCRCRRCAMNILLRCLPYILIGDFYNVYANRRVSRQ